MKIISNLLLTILLVLSTSCAQESSDVVMTVDQLKQEMSSNPKLIILDVRTEAELEGPLGKIDGVINIPIQMLVNRLDELDEYKDKDIAVICRSGNRSKTGTEILRSNGFNARNVIGGMIAYNKVKLP